MSTLGVEVTTKDLGVIRVEAIDQRGEVRINLTAEDRATRAMLSERLPELRNELRTSGLDLGFVDVSHGNASDRGRSNGNFRSPVTVPADISTPQAQDDDTDAVGATIDHAHDELGRVDVRL